MSGLAPKFISEKDVEAKKRNQEAEGVVEAPYDPRSLYERLQAEKDRKQEEYEAAKALKNRIHRLDEDEVEYLQAIAAKQRKTDLEQEKEVAELIKEAKLNAVRPINNSVPSNETAPRPLTFKGGPSQRSLLANALRRMPSITESPTSQAKRPNRRLDDSTDKSSTDRNTSSLYTTKQISIETSLTAYKSMYTSALEPVGLLPGLTEYSTSDSDQSTGSDSESTDIEDAVCTLTDIRNTRLTKTKGGSNDDG